MRPMVLLFVALFNSILGLSVLFPILGPLGRQLGLDEVHVGALSTAYALMQLLTASFWGRLSDTRGRKPILLVGIVGFAVGFLAFGLVARLGLQGVLGGTPLFVALLATRVLGGAFSSATLPTGQAYAADVSGRENRTAAMAVIGMAFGLGVIFGPAIGAGLSALFDDLLAPVYFSAGVAAVNAVFVATRLPEPERCAERAQPTRQLTMAGRLWPLLGVALTATLASVAMEQTVAFYFQDRLHIEELEAAGRVGLALTAYGVVAVLAQGFLVRRFAWSPRLLMRVGLPIAAAGLVLFVFAQGFGMLTSALVLQGLGQGLVLPGVTAALSLGVDEHEQGAVAGLNSTAQSLGRTLGPLVGTGLYRVQHELPYVFGAALLGLVLITVLARPRLGATQPAGPAE